MNYGEWAAAVAEEIKTDSLWKMTAYPRVIQLLLTMIPQQRNRALREQPEAYRLAREHDETLDVLLEDIPLTRPR